MELPYHIRKILNERLKVIESVEIAIVSNLSENVFVVVPTESENSIVSSEKISYLIYRIWKLLRDARWGGMEEIYIRGENKGMIAVPFGNNEFFTAVIFKYPTNLSLINRAIKETLKELQSVIVG